MRRMQRRHTRQWCARGGLPRPHFWHTLAPPLCREERGTRDLNRPEPGHSRSCSCTHGCSEGMSVHEMSCATHSSMCCRMFWAQELQEAERSGHVL